MKETDDLKAEMIELFPAVLHAGRAALHECDECNSITSYLSGRTWIEIETSFAEEFCDSLPLLSEKAYCTFLPGWLNGALGDPDSEAATMVIINLIHQPRPELFTTRQREIIGRIAEFVARAECCGPDDPVNIETLADLARLWPKRVGPN